MATPFATIALNVPPTVAPGVAPSIEAVTIEELSVVTTLPLWSKILTTMVPIFPPLTAVTAD